MLDKLLTLCLPSATPLPKPLFFLYKFPMSTPNQPTLLIPRHHVIMRLQAIGLTPIEISEIVGLTADNVTYVQDSDVYRAEYKRYTATLDKHFKEDQNKIRAKISELVEFGVQELEEILKDKATPRTLRANIVFELLDRDGYKAPKDREASMDYLDAMTRAYERKLAERRAS